MAEQQFIGSSLKDFPEAARAAFAQIEGDPEREGMKSADVTRMWMTGGGFVGVPQFHVELSVGAPARVGPDERRARWAAHGWYAYHDFMPGKAPVLHVGAMITARTGGWDFRLVRHEPPGINPFDLLLDLEVTPPEAGPDVITEYPVRCDWETDFPYRTVSILPYGPTSIEVQRVC